MLAYKKTSKLPSILYIINTRINYFHVTKKDILLMIKSLDLIKVHGCENMSVKVIKICNALITAPLKIIFEQLLKEGKFPGNSKKSKCCSSK